MGKVYHSVDGCYYKGTVKDENGVVHPIAHSAYQRKEILEQTVEVRDGVEYAKVRVIGHWKDYKTASEEAERWNRKQDEQSTSDR